MRSHLIVHITNSSSGLVDWVADSFLIHSTESINAGLSPIVRVSSTYEMKIAAPI